MRSRARATLDPLPDERLSIVGIVIPTMRAGDRCSVSDPGWAVDGLYFAENIQSVWTRDKTEASISLRQDPVDPGLELPVAQ